MPMNERSRRPSTCFRCILISTSKLSYLVVAKLQRQLTPIKAEARTRWPPLTRPMKFSPNQVRFLLSPQAHLSNSPHRTPRPIRQRRRPERYFEPGEPLRARTRRLCPVLPGLRRPWWRAFLVPAAGRRRRWRDAVFVPFQWSWSTLELEVENVFLFVDFFLHILESHLSSSQR